MKPHNHQIKLIYFNALDACADEVVNLLKNTIGVKDIKIINSKLDYKKALTSLAPEIIIFNNNLASFKSIEALNILKQSNLNIPFILLINPMDEEHAIAMLENGVNDYLIKDRLQRLPSAVINALKKNDLQKKKLKIKKNEIRYHSFFENSMDGLLLTITDGSILAANPAACAMFQMTEKEICQSGRFGLVDLTDDRLKLLIEERQRTGKAKGEITLMRKDGSKFPGEISSTVFKDSNGEERTSMIIRDLSERKYAEQERSKICNDLIQRSKTLEQFTYIVSHNLRAPIANILGISNVLKGVISETEKKQIQQYLFVAVDQLDEIIKDLNKILQVKTAVTENKELVSFPELVNGIESSIQNLIEKENVKIVKDFTAIDKSYYIKSYIHSVFYNLISNSIKYRQLNKQLIIKIKSEINKEKIKITFKDNGTGIDLNQHGEKIFGLYKRFHPNIEGKGLGLFMTKTQLEVMGGTIIVKSIPNVETKFIIELPL